MQEIRDEELASFDQRLEEGMTVRAVWRHPRFDFECDAVVLKVEARSVRVGLVTAVTTKTGEVLYPEGAWISFARFGERSWSRDCCVMPKT